MTKPLEITDARRTRVASPEFAEDMRRFTKDLRAQGFEERNGIALIVTRIAVALAGLEEPPSDRAGLAEFARFVDQHVAEIDNIADAMLKTLMLHDEASDTVH